MTYTWKTPRGAEIVLDIDVERIYEKKVKKALLYFFHLDQFVEL